MYFTSRVEAGYRLAMELLQYRYENVVVVALSDGGVLVGQQVAASLHCTLSMMLVDTIDVPGEAQTFGTLNQSGRFTYNGLFSAGEIESYYAEYHGYLEDQKRISFSKVSSLLGTAGIVSQDMLRENIVILISDGFENGASLDAAADFLRPVKVQKLIIAAPVASIEAVDRMHVLGDELYVLNATDNYLGADHYYDSEVLPDHEVILQILSDNVLNWR